MHARRMIPLIGSRPKLSTQSSGCCIPAQAWASTLKWAHEAVALEACGVRVRRGMQAARPTLWSARRMAAGICCGGRHRVRRDAQAQRAHEAQPAVHGGLRSVNLHGPERLVRRLLWRHDGASGPASPAATPCLHVGHAYLFVLAHAILNPGKQNMQQAVHDGLVASSALSCR